MRAAVRIGKVRLKNGPVVVRLPTTAERDRKEVERKVKNVLDAHDSAIAGMAIVVWADDGTSTADLRCWRGSVTRMQAPEFVKNRLMAEKILDWMRMEF